MDVIPSQRPVVTITRKVLRAFPVARYALFVLENVSPTIDPVKLLALQLRAAVPDGEWTMMGIDRAMELASMLYARQKVRTLTSLVLQQLDLEYTHTTTKKVYESVGSGDSSDTIEKTVPDIQKKPFTNFRIANGTAIFGFIGEQDRVAKTDELQEQNGSFLVAWSAAGHGNVSYVLRAMPTGFAFVPVWASSSAAGQFRNLAKLVGSFVLTVGLPMAGISAASALGNAIMGSLAATYPALTTVVGNIALSTAMNGGDVKEAVKGAALGAIGGNAGALIGSGVASASGIDLLGKIASNAASTLVQGGDVRKAVGLTLLQNGANVLSIFEPEPVIPGYGLDPGITASIDTGTGFDWGTPIDFSSVTQGPAFTVQPFIPGPATTTPAVFAAPAVAASPPLNFANVVNQVTNAALAAVKVLQVYKAVNSPAVVTQARVTTANGTQSQANDNGTITVVAGGQTQTTLPIVGVPHSTVSGNLIINNGNGTYTLVTPTGQTRTLNYASANASVDNMLGSLTSTFNSIPKPVLLGGAALALILILRG